MENLWSKISILTRKGQENSSKLAPSIPAPDKVSTFSTLPLRSYFKKHNVPGFKREYDPKCAPVTTILMVVNNLIEKEEKPEVTTNSKNDVKEVKSVDTNIPASEHVFDDKNQRPTSQVFDDEEHGDVPTVKSDHYDARTGEADHYEATLESTDQTDYTTEVSDDEKEALVHSSLCAVASQERKAVDVVSQERQEKEEVDVAPQEREEKEADADVASRERGEKGVDANVDATKLDNNFEVYADDESQSRKFNSSLMIFSKMMTNSMKMMFAQKNSNHASEET